MEPIAQVICNTPLIKGIQVGTNTEKVRLYADDMVLFLKDPGPPLKRHWHYSPFIPPDRVKGQLGKSLILPIDRETWPGPTRICPSSGLLLPNIWG